LVIFLKLSKYTNLSATTVVDNKKVKAGKMAAFKENWNLFAIFVLRTCMG
jgi:hypothetical protein